MTTPELSSKTTAPGLRRPRGQASTAFWMAVVLLAVMAIFSLVTPHHAFFQLSNFQAMGRDAVIGILIAVGMTFVLGSGHLDLSVGASLVLSSILGAQVMVAMGPGVGLMTDVLVGLLVCIGVGVGMGAINGLLVTLAKVNSFITTLATTGIASGIGLVLANGSDIPGVPPAIQLSFGVVNVGGIPVTLLLIAPFVIVLWVVLTKTRYGIWTVAIGSDLESAIRAGIPVQRHVFSIFVLSGGLAGIAGFLDISRFGSTDILGHSDDSLSAIAAVVIGGSSLFGGRASIGGSLIGACIPVVLGTGLVIAGLPSYYQQAVVGVILLIAVYLDQRRRSRASR